MSSSPPSGSGLSSAARSRVLEEAILLVLRMGVAGAKASVDAIRAQTATAAKDFMVWNWVNKVDERIWRGWTIVGIVVCADTRIQVLAVHSKEGQGCDDDAAR